MKAFKTKYRYTYHPIFSGACTTWSSSLPVICYMQYIIFHIKDVQSTVVIEDDDDNDEIRQLLREIELSQRMQDQETSSTLL